MSNAVNLRGYDPVTTGRAVLGVWDDDLPDLVADKAARITRAIAKVSDLHWSEFDDLVRRVVWTVDVP